VIFSAGLATVAPKRHFGLPGRRKARLLGRLSARRHRRCQKPRCARWRLRGRGNGVLRWTFVRARFFHVFSPWAADALPAFSHHTQ